MQAARRHAPQIAHLVQLDGADDHIISLAELEGTGASAFRFAETWRSVTAGDLATIIYTSGTTGPPKGVELTHANALAECRAWWERYPVTPGGRAISYLPTAHVVDRWSSHWGASLTLGFTVTSVADLRDGDLPAPGRAADDLRRRCRGSGRSCTSAGPGDRRPRRSARSSAPAARASGSTGAEHLGGGAAPMPIDVLRSFEALGLPIAEAWGMSETAGATIANPPGAIRAGTCGTALPGSRSSSRPTASCSSAARP